MIPVTRMAAEEDVEGIYNLILHFAEQRLLLERTRDEIRKELPNFMVAVSDSRVVGIISYFDYGPQLKEIRSFAVEESCQGHGTGRILIEGILTHLRNMTGARIFTLTYKPDFFKKFNFKEVPKDQFPEKIWKDCKNCKDKEECGETALIYLN